jgi:hypothetical protein
MGPKSGTETTGPGTKTAHALLLLPSTNDRPASSNHLPFFWFTSINVPCFQAKESPMYFL